MSKYARPRIYPSDAAPENYSSRRGTKIDTIVIHTTQGSLKSALYWFADPDAQASAHYVISGEDGAIFQCVDDADNAWHAGNGQVNRRSIGIECEGDCRRPSTWTPALVDSLCDLVAYLTETYHIPADPGHIMGHSDVPNPKDPSKKGGLHGHTDPGVYCPWDKIRKEAAAAAKENS